MKMDKKKKIPYEDLGGHDTTEEYLRGFIKDAYDDERESREAR